MGRKNKKNRTQANKEFIADLFYKEVILAGRRRSDFEAVTGYNAMVARRYFVEFYNISTVCTKKEA